jgi:DUF1365 family protein
MSADWSKRVDKEKSVGDSMQTKKLLSPFKLSAIVSLTASVLKLTCARYLSSNPWLSITYCHDRRTLKALLIEALSREVQMHSSI